jgi:hypothetical protein
MSILEDYVSEQVVVNLAVSGNIFDKEGLSSGGVYDRDSSGPLIYIYSVGEADDDGDIDVQHILIINEKSHVIFSGGRTSFIGNDEGDPDDEGSILSTITNFIDMTGKFGEEKGFEIADLLENLLISVDPSHALNSLEIEGECNVGDPEVVGNEPHSCFVSRFFAVNYGSLFNFSDPKSLYKSITEELNYDEYDSLDVSLIIK